MDGVKVILSVILNVQKCNERLKAHRILKIFKVM